MGVAGFSPQLLSGKAQCSGLFVLPTDGERASSGAAERWGPGPVGFSRPPVSGKSGTHKIFLWVFVGRMRAPRTITRFREPFLELERVQSDRIWSFPFSFALFLFDVFFQP